MGRPGLHNMGLEGCNREIATGDFIPHNKRLEQTNFGPVEIWDVDIQTVTEIRLIHELGYALHKTGEWSFDRRKQEKIIYTKGICISSEKTLKDYSYFPYLKTNEEYKLRKINECYYHVFYKGEYDGYMDTIHKKHFEVKE